jgi:glyoxylase-like metal-dependent hydrolase (beta-lactamase superfamily II)
MELAPGLHAFVWTSTRANNCNTYLIRSEQQTILIDPGHAAWFDHVRRGLHSLALSPSDIDLILCTHAHADHMEAVQLFENEPAIFALHADDWQQVLDKVPVFGVSAAAPADRLTPAFFLTEGQLAVGDIHLDVYHTPGHSPGGVTLHWPQIGALFTGDLIFNQGVGRTDLPGGNGAQLKESIGRVGRLDAQWLLSGHGEVISGASAVRENFERVQRTWFGYI